MTAELRKLKVFYDSLTQERETFTLPFSAVLQHKLMFTQENMGKIVGVAGITRDNSLFVVVKNEYQNQKIGQGLVEKVVREVRKRKLSYISLSAFQWNEKAIHVFTKLGFRTIYASSRNKRRFLVMVLSFNWKGTMYKSLLSIGLKILSKVRR